MSRILQLGGILFLLTRLLGVGQRFVQSRLDWKFLGIQKGDFSIDAGSQPGNLIGRLKIRMELTNNNPIPITITQSRATISQAGQPLGNISTNDPVTLEVGKSVVVGINMTIAASDIVIRIANIIKTGNVLAPINFDGVLYLSDQTVVPVNTNIQFLTVG